MPLREGWGFPGGSDGKESVCRARGPGSIPGSERSPGGRNSNPLQYPCLENSMDRGAWRATVHRVAKESDTTERLTLQEGIVKSVWDGHAHTAIFKMDITTRTYCIAQGTLLSVMW